MEVLNKRYDFGAKVLFGFRFNRLDEGHEVSPFMGGKVGMFEGCAVYDDFGLFLIPFQNFAVGDIDKRKLNFSSNDYITYLAEYSDKHINSYPYGEGMPHYTKIFKEICVYKANIISQVSVESMAEVAYRFCQEKQRRYLGLAYSYKWDAGQYNGDGWDKAFCVVRDIQQWHNRVIRT